MGDREWEKEKGEKEMREREWKKGNGRKIKRNVETEYSIMMEQRKMRER
jgi:hypothetical protein